VQKGRCVRELHVVAVSSDGKHLVLSPSKGSLKGSYLLAISPKLRKAVKGELRRPDDAPAPPPAESSLSPAEIQARLRAGQTPERVARAAGVPVERVTRFYGPVLSERARIIDEVRSAVLTRARRGPSAATLGDSVRANLMARKATLPEEAAWDALRRSDGCWVVRVDVVSRGRERRAEWVWDPTAREVTAVDPYAADLAYVDKPIVRRSARARKAPARTR
jgi:hypothetical protein